MSKGGIEEVIGVDQNFFSLFFVKLIDTLLRIISGKTSLTIFSSPFLIVTTIYLHTIFNRISYSFRDTKFLEL